MCVCVCALVRALGVPTQNGAQQQAANRLPRAIGDERQACTCVGTWVGHQGASGKRALSLGFSVHARVEKITSMRRSACVVVAAGLCCNQPDQCVQGQH